MDRPPEASPTFPLMVQSRPRADSMPNLPDRVEQMKYEGRYDGSGSASTSDDDDSPTGSSPRASPPLGRLVQAACEFCRLGHLRCDGVTPTCQQCAMRNRECIYSKPKRRGPKPGQLSKTRRPKGKATPSLDSLNAELAAQRSAAEQWKSRYYKLLQQNGVAPPDGQAAAEAPIDPSLLRSPAPPAMLSSYMRAYRTRILPLFPSISVPDSATAMVPSLQRSYVLYAIFAHGARAHGHENEANDLFARAREAAKELFLSTEADTLHGHLLMAFYHFLCGELESMSAFLALTLQTCREDALLPVHQQALVLKLYATPSSLERDLILSRLVSQQMHMRETVFALLASVYTDLRFARSSDDQTLVTRLADVERCMPQLGDAALPVVQMGAQCMLYGLRTVLLMRAQRPDLAVEQAARNTELSRHQTFRDEGSPYCVLGLDLSASTNVLLNPPLGQEDLHTLHLYRSIFPLSALAVERLHPVVKPVATLFDVTPPSEDANFGAAEVSPRPSPQQMQAQAQAQVQAQAAHAQAQAQAAQAQAAHMAQQHAFQQMQHLHFQTHASPAAPGQPPRYVSPLMVHIKTEAEETLSDHSESPTPDTWTLEPSAGDDWSSTGPSSAPAAFSFMRGGNGSSALQQLHQHQLQPQHQPPPASQPRRMGPPPPRAIPAHVFVTETGGKH